MAKQQQQTTGRKRGGKIGRPTKFIPFLEALEKFLNHTDQDGLPSIAAIIYTDEELVIAANWSLEPEQRISYSAFREWKAGRGNIEELSCYNKFMALYKRALMIQKHYVFKMMRTDPLWQRYAWIAQRKWREDWGNDPKDQDGGKPQAVLQINKTYIEPPKK